MYQLLRAPHCGGPAVICAEFILCDMQGQKLEFIEFRCSRKTLRKGPYILHKLYGNFSRWKQINFFILSGNLLLRENPFHFVDCSKSFDFKSFFVYLSFWGALFLVLSFLSCFIKVA